MIGKGLMIVALALSVADGCGRPGRDLGGDGNPNTGACEVRYDETVGGTHHRYPELAAGGEFVVGKVIVTCQKAPKTHRIEMWLQARKQGAGQRWKNVQYNESNHIPSPKEAVYHQGTCTAVAKDAVWRIKVHITGRGATEQGPNNVSWDIEDFSPERVIRCPK